MTSSSSPPRERGLDTMIVVYSLLHGHPASLPCEQFLRAHGGWFTSTLALLEAKAILTKVYAVDPAAVTQKLRQVAGGPIACLDLDPPAVLDAMSLADSLHIDHTDAALLHLVRREGARWLATEDHALAQACTGFGITVLSPFDAALRQQVAAWESAHLTPKGLPRILRRVHDWLAPSHPSAAQAFWSQTGGGSHLP
jgi:predicted nucleic acid-binding protein